MSAKPQRVSFRNSAGQCVVALLDFPKGKPPFPCVIITHGFKGFKEQRHIEAISISLVKHGFATLRFDSTNGVGESDGTLLNCTVTSYLRDIKAALAFLKKQKNIDSNRIGVAGHSMGGFACILAANRFPEIKVVAALSPPTDWHGVYLRSQVAEWRKNGVIDVYSRTLNRHYKVKFKFWQDQTSYDAKREARKLRVPTLLVHGTHDEAVKHYTIVWFAKFICAPHRLVNIPHADHNYKKRAWLQRVTQATTDWLAAWLL